jgi:hypothetical protein
VDPLIASRLRAHRLSGEPFASPVEAVGWFGAVQAQDHGAARWALGLRTRAATDAECDRLIDSGAILRTHVLRPTWHWVLPEDVRWLLELTGPRVRAGIAGRLRRLGIDNSAVSRSLRTFEAVLGGGRALERAELARALESAAVPAEGLRLGHLLLVAELEGVVISGPRRGRQPSWALLEERVAPAPRLDRETALGELGRRYFRGHGPATLRDLAWWAGLTAADARRGIAALGEELERCDRDGVAHWRAAGATVPAGGDGATAHLLPNFDEYTVGYADRGLLEGGRRLEPGLFTYGSVLSNVVVVEGLVRGGWAGEAGPRQVSVTLRWAGRPNRGERAAVAAAAERLGRFLERPVALRFG